MRSPYPGTAGKYISRRLLHFCQRRHLASSFGLTRIPGILEGKGHSLFTYRLAEHVTCKLQPMSGVFVSAPWCVQLSCHACHPSHRVQDNVENGVALSESAIRCLGRGVLLQKPNEVDYCATQMGGQRTETKSDLFERNRSFGNIHILSQSWP